MSRRSISRIVVMAAGPLFAAAALPAAADSVSRDADTPFVTATSGSVPSIIAPLIVPPAVMPATMPAVVLAAMPAASPTTCTEQACTGQRPEQTGCDRDGVTVRTGQVKDASGRQVGTIELRWSATCGVNWARVTSSVGVSQLQAVLTRSDNLSVSFGFYGTSTWSPMVSTRGHSAVATGWIGKASGAIADGVPTPGQHYN